MKRLLFLLLTITLFTFPKVNYAQAPTLGTAADFVLFTTTGAVTNMGIPFETLLTGNVGTNSAPTILGFGNVNGQMHYVGDPASMQCTADLNLLYIELDAAVPTFFPAVGLGGGQIFTPGVHYVSGPSVLGGDLILDGQNDPTSVFIIQIEGTFSTNSNSKVKLINDAMACNVFWMIEGAVDMGTGTTMRGTIVANNGAITMAVGDTLEGRALSTAGAILVNSIFGYTPIGCGSPILLGPAEPTLGAASCFGVFTSIGAHASFGVTEVDGDVGSNSTTTNGYVPLLVNGMIHGVPDGATGAAATDVGIAYNYLNGLVEDIILLEPTLFGHNLTLTPHIYLLPAAVTFTDTVFLDAQGEADAVFVIQVEGAFGTSTFSKVVLLNGADAANVFWLINGAVSINDFSIFNGTIIADGAITLATGVELNGRALTINGAISVTDAFVIIPPSGTGILVQPTDQTVCLGDDAIFTVGGSGSSYQWRRGIVNLVDGGNISGSNTATLTIDPVSLLDVANDYNVIVGGDCGAFETSVNVSLTIETSPIISTNPLDATVCVGDSTGFVVVATGSNLTYQWRKGIVNLVNGGNISGVDNDTLFIIPAGILDAANDYNVVITGSCTPGVTSNNAELIVNPIPVITSEPIDVTVCLGDSAAFVVVATGNNLTYQWRDGIVNLINGANISGVTNDTLVFDPTTLLDASLNYNVIVSGGCLTNDTSIMVELNVNSATVISTQPLDATVCVGDSTGFVVLTTGSNLTYQWRKGIVNLVNGGNISGVNNDTLFIIPAGLLDAANNYNVVISSACAPDITSNNAELIVNPIPVITIEPINSIVCIGDSAAFVVVATGNNLTYQWRDGILNLINGANISGVTNDTLVIDPAGLVDGSLNYNVIVSGGCLTNDTSIMVSLIVNSNPIITTEPANELVCEGAAAVFTVNATNAISYQWRKGTVNLVNGGNISGATTATLTINPTTLADAAIDYNVIVFGACSVNDTSLNAELVLTASPAANATSSSPVCTGDSLNLFTTTVVGATYDWTNTNGFTSTDQNPVITNATILDSDTYSVVVTANGCSSLPSSVIVSVDDCLDFFIPQGFSPNGDGINDLFVVRGIDRFPENIMFIYNRWGDKVFEATPYMNTWDGKSQTGVRVGGDVLPVGTYFYVLDLGDGSEVYKGTIYLNQ